MSPTLTPKASAGGITRYSRKDPQEAHDLQIEEGERRAELLCSPYFFFIVNGHILSSVPCKNTGRRMNLRTY
jgi:hypothetical protein